MKPTPTPTLLAALALALSLPVGARASTLAYCRLDQGYWQIWAANPDGANARPLTASPSDKRCLRAVPESNRVLFRDNEGRLNEIIAEVAASPRPVLGSIEVVKDFDLSPSRGFLISTYAPNATDNIRIWWHSADERQKRLLVAESKLNEMPRWQATNESFVFVKVSQGEAHIHRASLETPLPMPLFPQFAESTSDPAPSPDGRWLAFCKDGPQGMDLWLARHDGAEPRKLHAGPGLEAEPCWDAGSRTIFFSTWDGKNFRLARLGLNETNIQFLTPAGVDCRYPALTTEPKP
jgi:Tol biopolymer transport system component